jgi:hypothetical protein
VKAGFGRVDDPNPSKFGNFDQAQDWIEQRLAGAS